MRNEILRLPRRFLFLFFAGSCILIAAVYHNGPVKGQTVENAQNAVSQMTISGKSSGRQSSPSLIIVPNGMAAVTSTGNDVVTLRVVDISQFGPLWIPANYAPNYISTPGQMPLLNSWTPSQFNDSLGNQLVRGLALSSDGMRIYVGASPYSFVSNNKTPNIYRIGPSSTTPLLLSTLPSYAVNPTQRRGIAALDLDETHNFVFASNFADGIIYRINATAPGPPIDSFDPVTIYSGGATNALPPYGDRVIAVAYHKLENRLYYGIWGFKRTFPQGGVNSVRSVGLTASGAFDPPTDRLEFDLVNSLGPVADIEFNNMGNKILLAEENIDEGPSMVIQLAHSARGLEYMGGTGAWTIDTTNYAGSGVKYSVGDYNVQTNCRGGIAWAYASITGGGVISGNESFVMFTGDALNLTTASVYGLQYTPSTGGAAGGGVTSNSLIADLDYDVGQQDKYIYGDVDIRRSLITNAAEVSITGRVITANGAGISKASVILTNVRGESRTALTNPFGYYRLELVRAGETFTMQATAKGKHFTPRILTVDDDMADVNFTALD